MLCLLDNKGVIHIPVPHPRWACSSTDGFDFKLFHEKVGHNGADGRTHGSPMNLLIILTLQEVSPFLPPCTVFPHTTPSRLGSKHVLNTLHQVGMGDTSLFPKCQYWHWVVHHLPQVLPQGPKSHLGHQHGSTIPIITHNQWCHLW